MADADNHFAVGGGLDSSGLFGLLAAGAQGDGGGQHTQRQGLFMNGILSG